MAFTAGAVLTAAQLNTFEPGTKIKTLDGSASAPTYTFKFADGTGMFRTGSDGLAFATGGTQRATIDSSGITANLVGNQSGGSIAATTLTASGDANFDSGTLFVDASENRVGVGTTTPAGLFELTANTSEMIFSSSPNKTNRYRFDANFTDSADFGFSTSYWDGSAYVRIITLLDNGRVGIGTTSPATPLEVSTSSGQVLRLTNTTSSTKGPYISLFGSSTRVGFVGFPNNDDLHLKNETSAGEIILSTNSLTRVKVTSGGVLQWYVSSGIGGPLTDTSSTSGFRYVLQNQTFGTLQDFTSIRERKEQVTNVTTADSARWIDALQPVTYVERWLGEGEEPADNKQWREADMQVGFIADDVLASSDTSHFAQATDNGEGGLNPSGWKWETVIAAAVAEIKSLRARVATLEA